MDDHFRPIPGYPGYRVSRLGEVQSCWTRHGRRCLPSDSWRPLKPIDRGGYATVNLAREGRKSAHRIHRLVLNAFLGPCPEGWVGCHNDGDPSNNRIENLRWDTQQANVDDALRHGTRAMGSRCNAKLVEDDVLEIRRLRADGVPTAELAGRYAVSEENIKAIVARRSWRHLP